jgi:lipopolysaccharide biosynthesis glycosyltransferase
MNVFVGYDPREDIAYQVCEYSILKHRPTAKVSPLAQKNLPMYTRPLDPLSSSEFTFTRFLVPYLAGYQGWAVFCDCDFLWTADIKELFDQADENYAVMIVKHDHVPNTNVKMDNQPQAAYPRKNWSSCILWNCGHVSNQQLTPDLINQATGQYLHRFSWLSDEEIGSLDTEWNWLVGYNQNGTPKAIHYTEGGPWFKNYRSCEYSGIWKQYLLEMLDES